MTRYSDIIATRAMTPDSNRELELSDDFAKMAHTLTNVSDATMAFDFTKNPLQGMLLKPRVNVNTEHGKRRVNLRKFCDFIVVTESADKYEPIFIEFAKSWVDPFTGDKFEQLFCSLPLFKLFHMIDIHSLFGSKTLGSPRFALIQNIPPVAKNDSFVPSHILAQHPEFPRSVICNGLKYGKFTLYSYGTPRKMMKIGSAVIDKDSKLDIGNLMEIPVNDNFQYTL